MSEAAFFILAVLTVVAAAGVIVLSNPVHSAMSLVMTLFLIAVHYVALQAHLVAALQIIVYAGAVMVLFLFVIMLLNLQAEEHPPVATASKALGIAAAATLALMLGRALWPVGPASSGVQVGPEFGTTRALGLALFKDNVVAFELTSLLLLVAVVGSIVLARRERT
jgi:NADH-quinone oxidoreductase subunit J